jgi:hypothetical protein
MDGFPKVFRKKKNVCMLSLTDLPNYSWVLETHCLTVRTNLTMTSTVVTLFFFYCCAGNTWWIYKSSYNISNISHLNSSPPPFSFILPHSWNSFNICSTYIHVYTVFGPYSPSIIFRTHTHNWSHWYQPPTGFVLPSCFPIL